MLGATGQTVVWGNNGGPNGCDNPKHAAADHIQGARKQQYSPQIAAQQESQVALELNTSILTLAHLKKGGLLEQKRKNKNFKILDGEDDVSFQSDIFI